MNDIEIIDRLFRWGRSDELAKQQAAIDLLDENFRAWHPGIGWLGKDEHVARWDRARTAIAEGLRPEIVSITGSDGIVAVEQRVGGLGTDDVQLFFFNLCGGKVCEERIYNFVGSASALFGPNTDADNLVASKLEFGSPAWFELVRSTAERLLKSCDGEPPARAIFIERYIDAPNRPYVIGPDDLGFILTMSHRNADLQIGVPPSAQGDYEVSIKWSEIPKLLALPRGPELARAQADAVARGDARFEGNRNSFGFDIGEISRTVLPLTIWPEK